MERILQRSLDDHRRDYRPVGATDATTATFATTGATLAALAATATVSGVTAIAAALPALPAPIAVLQCNRLGEHHSLASRDTVPPE